VPWTPRCRQQQRQHQRLRQHQRQPRAGCALPRWRSSGAWPAAWAKGGGRPTRATSSTGVSIDRHQQRCWRVDQGAGETARGLRGRCRTPHSCHPQVPTHSRHPDNSGGLTSASVQSDSRLREAHHFFLVSLLICSTRWGWGGGPSGRGHSRHAGQGPVLPTVTAGQRVILALPAR